jgi:hypothetical protein
MFLIPGPTVSWSLDRTSWASGTASQKPDLTPLDFYLWGHLKAQVYAEKIRNVEHLLQNITEARNAITPDIIKRVFVD